MANMGLTEIEYAGKVAQVEREAAQVTGSRGFGPFGLSPHLALPPRDFVASPPQLSKDMDSGLSQYTCSCLHPAGLV